LSGFAAKAGPFDRNHGISLEISEIGYAIHAAVSRDKEGRRDVVHIRRVFGPQGDVSPFGDRSTALVLTIILASFVW